MLSLVTGINYGYGWSFFPRNGPQTNLIKITFLICMLQIMGVSQISHKPRHISKEEHEQNLILIRLTTKDDSLQNVVCCCQEAETMHSFNKAWMHSVTHTNQ